MTGSMRSLLLGTLVLRTATGTTGALLVFWVAYEWQDPRGKEHFQHAMLDVVDWVRELGRIDPDTLVRKRFEKFRSIGSVR